VSRLIRSDVTAGAMQKQSRAAAIIRPPPDSLPDGRGRGEGGRGGIKCTFLIWTESGENVHELQIRDSSVGRSFGAFLRGDRRCRRVTLIINKYSYPLGSRT